MRLATVEQVTTFALLQSQLAKWEPSSHAPHELVSEAVSLLIAQEILQHRFAVHKVSTTSLDIVCKGTYFGGAGQRE